jgi:diguanylate cyclase (GGDEF)-like protein
LVLKDNNEIQYEDLSSTNGTEVNGQLIPANVMVKLKNNDQIKLGNVIFKFLEKGNIESVAAKGTYDRTQIDPLTQAYNKGALMTTGEEVFKRAKLTDTAMTLIVFDLDHFKKINDTFGHPAGDFVLKELASIIQNRLIRQGDFFARFGGEEFCLLLIGGPLQRGVEVAERIRSTVEKNEFIYDGKKMPVTISAGVATLEKSMNSWNELFEKADKAAYLAKTGGRNRVSTI